MRARKTQKLGEGQMQNRKKAEALVAMLWGQGYILEDLSHSVSIPAHCVAQVVPENRTYLKTLATVNLSRR